MPTLDLYLIRHGRTEWNISGRLQGICDSLLTQEGIENAKRTGQALQNITFNACYSSMLKRAIDTANYIIGERDIPHFHHSGLNEINFGLWEGLKMADLVEHPEYQLMKTQPALYQAKSNQGENYEQLYHRITKTFNQIVQQHPNGGNVLVVSHGTSLTLLTAVLKGLHWNDFRNHTKHAFLANTSISIVKIKNNQSQLIQFNRQEHLS